jgi:hypothetical protein
MGALGNYPRALIKIPEWSVYRAHGRGDFLEGVTASGRLRQEAVDNVHGLENRLPARGLQEVGQAFDLLPRCGPIVEAIRVPSGRHRDRT